MQENLRKKVELSNKIFPWFSGLSGDLIFFIAIDTLFLTQVKGLNAAQISIIGFISCFFCVVLQKIILKIIEKIGNNASMKLGTILLLLSSVFLIIGKDVWILSIYKIFRDMAKMFMIMKNVILKDNLIYTNQEELFVPITTKAQSIYAVITTINAVAMSYLYKINNYLPIYISILFNTVWIVMSFFITDIVEKNKLKIKNKEQLEKIELSKIIILIFIVIALFSGISNASQNKVKLLIQYDFINVYSVENVAMYLGIVVLLSRIGRVFSNIIFEKTYAKLKDKMGVILSIMMSSLFIITLIGHCLDINQYLKNILMTIGFVLILALRDPFEIYIHDLILRISPVDQYQRLMYISNIWTKISEMLLELLATIILLGGTLETVLILFFIIMCIEVAISIKLYKEIKES